jgi:methionine synthase II (cobalamin-independent)
MGYTVKQVEEIASKLRALPAIEPPPKDLTKSDVVKMLAKEIKSLQKRGYSLEQIASSLKGEGLDISTPTLKSYLQKAKAPGLRAKAGKGSVGAKQISPVVDGSADSSKDLKTETETEAETEPKPNRKVSSGFTSKPDLEDL